MLQIHSETIFLEKVQIGSTVKTQKLGFLLITQGSITLEINTFLNTYEYGSIIIIAPHSVYKVIDYTDDLKMKLLVGDREEIKQKILINFNKYDAYRAANSERGYNLKFETLEFESVLLQIQQIEFYLKNPSNALFCQEIIWLTFNTLMYSVFGKLLSLFNADSQTTSRKEEIVVAFVQLLSENFKKEKELEFYANQLNISVKYLSNSVREITKTPPKFFIADKLINEAKILLLDQDKTIKSIADELGFSDQYAFGKFFKKHTGYSPKHYKQQNKLITSF